jgi:hypothetical protein
MILDPHWNGVLMHVGKVAEVRKRVDETKAKRLSKLLLPSLPL